MINFRIFILLTFLFCQVSLVLSQTTVDSIAIVNNYSVHFSKNGKRLSPGKLLREVKSNPEAYAILKHAKDSRDIGTIMGCIGSFMVGYAVGGSFGEGKLDKIDLASGGILVLCAIPFTIGFSAKSVKAVKVYNNGLRASH